MKVFNNIKDICSFINHADRDLITRNLTVYDANTNKAIAIVIKDSK
jgi:hypothetical protein